jgi:hypothetical protein
MTYIGTKDFALEVSRGNVAGVTFVNKFGHAPDGIQTTATDFWCRADATPTQQIWVAPTTARTHDIVSTSTDDDGNPAGVGALTLRVYGLTGWGAAEVTENITMNGTTNVATSNAYVIIHRMEVLTKGATNVNVGVITATAQTDGTVTAQINAGVGQTNMALYGIPSTQKAYVTRYYVVIEKAQGVAASITTRLLYNPEPDAELTNFLTKHITGVQSTGTGDVQHVFNPYYELAGPAIIKVQGIASAADVQGSAGFDAYLVDN